LIGALLILVITIAPVGAHPIINEVMVNEPGSYQYLEWIELYADSSGATSLDNYVITINDSIVTLPSSIDMPSGSYLVLCRKLVSADGTASFEGRWGDSSGVWGDCEVEQEIATPVVADFKLRNDAGIIQILQNDVVVSQLTWPNAGDDGKSWERLEPVSDSVVPSVAGCGSTPGRLNSLTPVAYDLAVARVYATVRSGLTAITITVANRGRQAILYSTLDLSFVGGGLIESFAVENLPPGDSIVLVGQYALPGMRAELTARLPDDDREANNFVVFYAPGGEFPPVHVTEIMADPDGDNDNEWIEVRNIHYENVDLRDWKVGDFLKLCLVSDTSLILALDERLVIGADGALFRDAYPAYDGLLAEPSCWAQLNNGGDTVIFQDPFGLEADRIGYADLPESGHTLCRGEDQYADRWGPSEESGGSPGRPNAVLFASDDSRLSLTVEPELFSPDGDGLDDSTLISIAAPEMDQFELRIYDREGRVVHRFDTDNVRRNSYTWRGCAERGRRLPIGLYIVYFEVPGIGSIKKPVVIAR